MLSLTLVLSYSSTSVLFQIYMYITIPKPNFACVYNLKTNYTEANSQRNTDVGVHIFVLIFIQIMFIDKTFRQ